MLIELFVVVVVVVVMMVVLLLIVMLLLLLVLLVLLLMMCGKVWLLKGVMELRCIECGCSSSCQFAVVLVVMVVHDQSGDGGWTCVVEVGGQGGGCLDDSGNMI